MTPQEFVDQINFKVFPQLGYTLSPCGNWWVWPCRLDPRRYPANEATRKALREGTAR